MQDDLQKAYSAYQQALYLLPNPKVCSFTSLFLPNLRFYYFRKTQSFGTELEYSTIVMGLSITPKKPFRLFFVWIKVSLTASLST